MKKILFSLMALVTLSLGFTSCSSDDEVSFATTAEAGSAGTYTGTYVVTAEDGTSNSYTGTITLAAAADKAGCTNVTFTCADASLEKTSIANVCHANNGYNFTNQSGSNGLGVAFAGKIDESGNCTCGFTMSQRVGRKTVLNKYAFTGKK